jgi:hypothetical protein
MQADMVGCEIMQIRRDIPQIERETSLIVPLFLVFTRADPAGRIESIPSLQTFKNVKELLCKRAISQRNDQTATCLYRLVAANQ